MRFGTTRRDYMELFADGLAKAAAHAKPDLIVLSAGFDAHIADSSEPRPGDGRLRNDDRARHGRRAGLLQGSHRQLPRRRLDVEALAACVEAHLAVLHDRKAERSGSAGSDLSDYLDADLSASVRL